MPGKSRTTNAVQKRGSSNTSAQASNQGKLNVKMLPYYFGNTVIFPARWKRTFTCSGSITLTADGLGTIQKQTLSLNSLFDPDYSGVGLVPRYYQALLGNPASTAPYSKYCVTSARVRFQFANSGANNASIADVGVYVRPVSAAAVNTTAEMYETEMGRAWTLGSGYSDNGVIAGCIDIDQKLLSAMQNCKDLEDSYVNFGTYNSDPSTEILCDLMYCPYVSSSTNQIYLRWTIEQDAILFGLNEVDQSQLVRDPKKVAVPANVPDRVGHPTGCFCEPCSLKSARGLSRH